jgi:putative restriction endonuclease
MSDSFEVGQTYSWITITKELGVDNGKSLPYSKEEEKVLCARLTPGDNPDAPHTIPIGPGPERKKSGRLLAEQDVPVPVFLKEETGEWRHIGLFESVGDTTDPDRLEDYSNKAEQRDRPVAQLVFLEAVEEEPLESEVLRRERMWKRLVEAGGPSGVETDLLRELRIYRGQAGMWTDKKETEGVLPEGGRIAVSVLHTGEHYPDGLSDGELIYKYPETDRPGTTDAAEIEATKNAALGDVPIFVVLQSEEDPTLRDVYWGRVTDWNDTAREFLIQFRLDPDSFRQAIQEIERREDAFNLTSDRSERKQKRTARPGQQQFRFKVKNRYGLRCAVCEMSTEQLLEAAHFRGRGQGGSNDPRNGITLCRNHHKAFDDGLFAVRPDTLEVYLKESGPSAEELGITRPQLEPERETPHQRALQWAWSRWQEALEDENARPVA